MRGEHAKDTSAHKQSKLQLQTQTYSTWGALPTAGGTALSFVDRPFQTLLRSIQHCCCVLARSAQQQCNASHIMPLPGLILHLQCPTKVTHMYTRMHDAHAKCEATHKHTDLHHVEATGHEPSKPGLLRVHLLCGPFSWITPSWPAANQAISITHHLEDTVLAFTTEHSTPSQRGANSCSRHKQHSDGSIMCAL